MTAFVSCFRSSAGVGRRFQERAGCARPGSPREEGERTTSSRKKEGIPTATTALEQKALSAVPALPRMLIGGRWVDVASGKTFPTFNPATGEKLGDVPMAGREDVDGAVQAAQQAFPAWSRMDARERGKLVARIAGRLRFARRFFVEPTVFDGVAISMRPAREESLEELPSYTQVKNVNVNVLL